jgi:hypothetical protein
MLAEHFHVKARPEILEEEGLYNPTTGETYVGLCHYDRILPKFAACAAAWAGVLAECLGGDPGAAHPKFVPTSKTLRLWYEWMLANGINSLSSGDRRGILDYPNPWLGLRTAYKVVRSKIRKLKRTAETIVERADQQSRKESSRLAPGIFRDARPGDVPGVLYYTPEARKVLLDREIARLPDGAERSELRAILEKVEREILLSEKPSAEAGGTMREKGESKKARPARRKKQITKGSRDA